MKYRTLSLVLAMLTAGSGVDAGESVTSAPASQPLSSTIVSLDGDGWRIATDPKNEGREAKWFAALREEAKPTKVPWIIQDAFPGYHGVAWYWREFAAPKNPHAGGRCLLRFWAVDYLAEVWLNGTRVGGHEGGESPFVLDVTETIRAGGKNLLAVRVLNPTNEPIDGIVLGETPHRNKVIPYRAGASYNHGGIVDSVEFLVVPVVRVEDLFARPDTATG
ncbi:MAG: glycoside hydrolase family 2, partial [Verrucomicrobia bacterium]|nr:glycoside hydrolase family 2 [Verrucomicrobiota bacterium]